MWYIILSILLLAYMIYGITHAVKNRLLTRFEKTVWIIIIACMPVLGTSLYLRSTFRVRD
ncbi:PLDc N-terminal domain-containing protein [Pedobacter africanus]|uniref:PLDc N-terminal domain-containing protein n=1 Tax=Pedobacter africanus TaxID=151894 RepID=UPI003396793E